MMGPIDFLNALFVTCKRRGVHLVDPTACIDKRRAAAVKECHELRGAIAEALAVDGPAIVDCIVAPDELPNMPRIDLGLAKNYAIAKIKEAVIAATRR